MHELAIAQSVVAIADRHASGRRVASVQLKVGHLRQVVPSALTFAFQLVAEGTVLEGAELEIEVVPAAGATNAALRITPERIAELANAKWIDVGHQLLPT